MDIGRTGNYGMFGHRNKYEVCLSDDELRHAQNGEVSALNLGIEAGRSAVVEYGVQHEDNLDICFGTPLRTLSAFRIGLRVGRDIGAMPVQIEVKELAV